jgi:hypothetical protein
MEHFLNPWAQFGIIGLVLGAIIFILWRMIVWVMAFVKDITAQHAQERKDWKVTSDKQNDVIEKIRSSLDRHDERADERGSFVKKEHEDMIKALETIKNSLTQTEQALGRINGYVKER